MNKLEILNKRNFLEKELTELGNACDIAGIKIDIERKEKLVAIDNSMMVSAIVASGEYYYKKNLTKTTIL